MTKPIDWDELITMIGRVLPGARPRPPQPRRAHLSGSISLLALPCGPLAPAHRSADGEDKYLNRYRRG